MHLPVRPAKFVDSLCARAATHKAISATFAKNLAAASKLFSPAIPSSLVAVAGEIWWTADSVKANLTNKLTMYSPQALRRCFVGDQQQMFSALIGKLSKLPEDTLVYCGHEYTLTNLKFAAKAGGCCMHWQ